MLKHVSIPPSFLWLNDIPLHSYLRFVTFRLTLPQWMDIWVVSVFRLPCRALVSCPSCWVDLHFHFCCIYTCGWNYVWPLEKLLDCFTKGCAISASHQPRTRLPFAPCRHRYSSVWLEPSWCFWLGFFWWLIMLSIFSCSYWPFVYVLWGNARSNLLLTC